MAAGRGAEVRRDDAARAQTARADGARVHEVLAQPVADAGLVLEAVSVTPAGRRKVVRVTVDLPDDETGSLDLDRLAEVSRAINTAMDDAEPLGETPFVLEVSSPGVNRPLTERRHWLRARTRLVAVPVGEVEQVGRLTEVDDEGITLLVYEAQQRFGWAELGTGHVQVEFSRQDDDATDDELADDSADDVVLADSDEQED